MYYAITILNVLAAAIAQILLKKSTKINRDNHLKEYLNGWVLGGYTLMGFSVIGNIFVMNKGLLLKEVSILGSLNYLFIPLLAFFFFNERLTKKKISSIMVILIGTIIFYC